MKKYLTLAVIAMAIILGGCVGQKTVETSTTKVEQPLPEEEAVLLENSFWVLESENMPYLADAVARNDIEYLNQLMLEGKVFKVDKDTKVVRFGVAADENNVLIKFKEGRYTNKAGCTFKNNVIAEEEFSAYLEEQNKVAKNMIQNYLSFSENYFELITASKVEEAKRMLELCDIEDRKMIEKKNDTHINLATKECIEKARNVIFCRFYAVSSYLDSVGFSQKIDQEDSSSKEIPYYKKRQEEAQKTVNEYHQKAEKLREEFHDKYGF